MTNDEILQAAKESELYLDGVNQSMPLYVMKTEDLQRFAAIIEKHTIERCESVLMQLHKKHRHNHNHFHYAALQVAAIRKLGEQE